jgi:hypothetical protein
MTTEVENHHKEEISVTIPADLHEKRNIRTLQWLFRPVQGLLNPKHHAELFVSVLPSLRKYKLLVRDEKQLAQCDHAACKIKCGLLASWLCCVKLATIVIDIATFRRHGMCTSMFSPR